MDKIRYYFAAVYQSLKKRRPDGTPYFNLSVAVAAIFLLNLLNILLAVQIWGHKKYISDSKGIFMTWYIGFAIFVVYIFRQIIPLEDIQDIEVDKKDVRVLGNSLIFVFFLCVGVMGWLLFHLIPAKH